MASPMLGKVFARTIIPSRLTRCSRTQHMRPSAASQPNRLVAGRNFAVSARAWEKRYTEDHEWVELSEDGSSGTIGITEYAAKALGDVVYVELPTADLEVTKGDAIGAVESVKSASDIMTPISGIITEGNQELESKPGTINKSPLADGWLAKIKPTKPEELESLMDSAAYQKFTDEAGDH